MGFLLGFVLAASTVHAGTWDVNPYYTLGSVKVHEVQGPGVEVYNGPSLPVPVLPPGLSPAPSGDADSSQVILDQIINGGKKLWAIVAAGRPVMNVQTDSANALPQGVHSWSELQGWQTPKSKIYQVQYVNLYQMTVVDFSFRVLFAYGGNLGGKGNYLSYVTVIPDFVSVAWGYRFDAQSSVVNVMNAGTVVDPLAAMELQVEWGVETPLRKTKNTANYLVRGDGGFLDLSSGNF